MLIFNTSYFQENSKSQGFPWKVRQTNSKTLCFSANFHSPILRMDVKPNVISTFLRNVAVPRCNKAVNLIKRLYWTRKFNTLTIRCELKCHFHNDSSSTRYSDIETFQVHQLLNFINLLVQKKNLFSFYDFTQMIHPFSGTPNGNYYRWKTQ